MIELHPETRRILTEQHEHLAEARRLAREVLEATDRHIDLILRILNGRGDQSGLDKATRKYVRANTNLSSHFGAYMKQYVKIGEKKE